MSYLGFCIWGNKVFCYHVECTDKIWEVPKTYMRFLNWNLIWKEEILAVKCFKNNITIIVSVKDRGYIYRYYYKS